MTEPSSTSHAEIDNRVLAAVRLGWLTVEAFGRLRRFARSNRTPRSYKGDARKRFKFSNRELTDEESLHLATDELRYLASSFEPELPPVPIPDHEGLHQAAATAQGLDELHGKLDKWGKHVWVKFAIGDELLGRAYTYGGSLADTYWHSDASTPDNLSTLLREQRLEYIAARFESIGDHLPPHVAQILHHTLYKWRIQKELDSNRYDKKRVLRRLESQAKVWHDLLFDSRTADSYLTRSDYRRINWGTAALTALTVLTVVVLVWLVVLSLSTVGRSFAAMLTTQIDQASAAFIEDLGDWQSSSALLATLSAAVVLISGFTTRLSGWLLGSYNVVHDWLKRNRIHKRTYRNWRV